MRKHGKWICFEQHNREIESMKDENKTQAQFIEELAELRQRVDELERGGISMDSGYTQGAK